MPGDTTRRRDRIQEAAQGRTARKQPHDLDRQLRGPLCGPLLCQTVTQHFIKVRVLGFSKAVLIVNGALLFATGNNLKLYGDILRRPDRPARCLRGAPRVAHLRAATAYCRFRAIAATSPEVTGQYDMNLLNRG
jgi:hypothetical protein